MAEASAPVTRTGRIVTFYSYKGGTGRTMALANVAWLLASQGLAVLVVDWDFEAPGLHRYLHPFLFDKELERTEGLIDCIIDYTTETVTRLEQEKQRPAEADWVTPYANILRYATTLKQCTFPGNGRIDLLPAGRQDSAYSTKVNTFDWKSFYERHGGGSFLDRIRQRMRAEYDYVLIDSRTGVSDTSGICTIQMPDDLVICFTLNNQSIIGASRIAHSAMDQRHGDLRVFPVPTRVEQGEKDKLELRRRLARRRFGLLPAHLDAAGREQYWGDAEILYVPYYAYEEMLAPFGDEPGRLSSVLASAERLAGHLRGELTKLTPIDPDERQRVLRIYAQAGTEDGVATDPASVAERAYLRLTEADQVSARRLFLRLVHVAGRGENVPDAPVHLPVNALDRECQAVAQVFIGAQVLVTESTGFAPTVQIADPALIQQWKRLRDWLDSERDFLEWRQTLRTNMADWERNKRDVGALLTGAPLAVARGWAARRPSDLSPAELGYIRQGNRVRWFRWAARGAFAALIAVSVWSVTRRHDSVTLPPDQTAGALALVVQGDSLAARGLSDSAAKLYQDAIAHQPTFALAYVRRGRLLDARGDSAAAIEAIDHAIQLQDTLSAAWFARADFYARRGQTRRAVADLTRGLSYDSTNASAYLRLGRAQEELGETGQAIAHYSKSIDLSPTTDAYLSRGVAFTRVGKRTSAAADYQTVLRIATDSQDVTVARARLRQLGAGSRPTGGTTSPPTPVVTGLRQVRLFYNGRSDGALVADLAHLLDSLRFKVPTPILRLDRVSSAVAYFSSENERVATQIRDALQLRLATHGIKLDLQLLYRDPASVTGLDARDIAVWLPAFGQGSPAQAY